MMNRRAIFGFLGIGAAAAAAPLITTAAVIITAPPEPLNLWKPQPGEIMSARTMANMIQQVEDAINRLNRANVAA